MDTLKSRVYLDLLQATLQDAYSATVLSPHAQEISIAKDIDCARLRCESEGTAFFSKSLAKVGSEFTRSLDGSTHFRPSGLKLYKNKSLGVTALPAFARKLFLCTHNDDGLLRQEADPRMIQLIRTVLFLTYKVREEFSDETTANYTAAFISCDSELANAPFVKEVRKDLHDKTKLMPKLSERYEDLLREARILVHKVISDVDPLDIVPSHGPGAVSTGEKPWMKPYHQQMAEPMGDVYDISYYVSGAHAICDNYRGLLNSEVGFCDIAKVCFVPKDSRGPRTITCEPIAKQWIQQGLMKAMKMALSRSALTRDFVVLDDQSVNATAACLSSVLGTFASIDLKDASDRIPLELIEYLFPENWVRCMKAARSSVVRFDRSEEVHILNKYAGMGNATTFPTEALCFWAICHALARRDSVTTADVYVYGDDILVDPAIVGAISEVFQYIGLKVNVEKSFVKGPFRESCGMDAFRGSNTAPIRLKGLLEAMAGEPSALKGLVQMANENWTKHPFLASAIYRLVKQYSKIPVYNSDVVISDALMFNLGHELTDTIPVRWSPDVYGKPFYQRREFRVPVVTPEKILRKRDREIPHHWCDVLQVLVKPGLRVYSNPDVDQYTQPNRCRIKLGWRAESTPSGRKSIGGWSPSRTLE